MASSALSSPPYPSAASSPGPASAPYRRGLSWFATASAAWVFVVVTMGAFTTSIGAGMAFPDWPLSNGSINPEGWLRDIYMFAEHSHRLFGMVMGMLAIGTVVWLHKTEPRAWVRRLGWAALAIVVVQGMIGGKRVLLDSIAVPGFDLTLGQMLTIPHGILAQLYVCVLFAVAASQSRAWLDGAQQAVPACLRRAATGLVALVVAQLVIAAVMRHNMAGLAIPSFPQSTTSGDWLPAAWDFRVGIHFAHRVMAVVLTVAIVSLAIAVWRQAAASAGLRRLAGALVVLLGVQITLGAATVLTYRDAYYTTGHVIVGALTLATAFLLAFWMHRPLRSATSV
ncbi:MAG: COX15/CtaA family protein [Opitutaceae bacterium]|jgi:cytochrome c oxidase assembly protein subunit 15|nr:COX15/CtaA family protein [Opitutaceae bacterium]